LLLRYYTQEGFYVPRGKKLTDEYYVDQEDIICDFLRKNLTDPKSRAEDSETNDFTATAGQTVFTITATTGSVSCITSITVDGTSSKKWQDYYWDYQNSKITFFTALTVGQAVIVTFKQGTTNWIYSDKPDEALAANSFPRISIFSLSGAGERLGQYEAPFESSPIMQIDIWARNEDVNTIDSRKYSNNYLTRYLGNRIKKALEQNEEDLFPLLYNYRLVGGPRAAPYSVEYQAYHSVVEINVKGLQTGRIEVN